jgi:dUTP pyrophosphatase
LLEERGSTGTKNMKRNAGVIDSGFRNEWFVCLYNGNDKPVLITKETIESALQSLADDYIVYPYSKAICQALLLPVPKVSIEELSYEELKLIPSSRGMGQLGSSGK